MTHLILFLGFGLGLLAAVYLLVVRKPASMVVGSAQALLDARRSLRSLQFALLPQEFVARVFAEEDYAYIQKVGLPSIQRMFLQQRKRIALSWVNRIRLQISGLMQFHRSYSRFYERLSVPMELSMAGNFATLLFCCRALQISILLRGPYAAGAVARRAVKSAYAVCDLTGRSLAFLNPTPAMALHKTSAGGGAL
ncbi:MAG: hypothetical protein ACRD5R_03335 [Candidatus Acidiferrales bacterium]